jgi:hypothetical protein
VKLRAVSAVVHRADQDAKALLERAEVLSWSAAAAAPDCQQAIAPIILVSFARRRYCVSLVAFRNFAPGSDSGLRRPDMPGAQNWRDSYLQRLVLHLNECPA